MHQSPKNSTKITYWILFCIMCIILAILEYAFLIAYKKFRKKTKVKGMSGQMPSDDQEKENMSELVDIFMILMFPPAFAIFSLIFWAN